MDVDNKHVRAMWARYQLYNYTRWLICLQVQCSNGMKITRPLWGDPEFRAILSVNDTPVTSDLTLTRKHEQGSRYTPPAQYQAI